MVIQQLPAAAEVEILKLPAGLEIIPLSATEPKSATPGIKTIPPDSTVVPSHNFKIISEPAMEVIIVTEPATNQVPEDPAETDGPSTNPTPGTEAEDASVLVT